MFGPPPARSALREPARATAAPFVHGRAGDLVAAELGEEGLVAGDLIEALPRAVESLRKAAGGGRPSGAGGVSFASS